MLFEHWIYSTAIEIIAGMIHFKRTCRDYSWIIIASAYAPDFDIFADAFFNRLGITLLFDEHPVNHGDFHNIAVLLLFAGVVALLLQVVRYRFVDAFLFAGFGFIAHIFEDALVYYQSYPFWWPISANKLSIGLIEFNRDFYHIADTRVLFAGVMALILCGNIRQEWSFFLQLAINTEYFMGLYSFS